MFLMILKFDTQEIAEAAFTEAGLDINSDITAYQGPCQVPGAIADGSSVPPMVTFYFVMITTIDIPSSLAAFEYDYSYPVLGMVNVPG